MPVKVLFVCLGNICRSPTAHGVFQGLLDQHGLNNIICVDSAGTAAWHVGKSPDTRSCEAAAKRGYDLSHLSARQVVQGDFDEYDYVLAMDVENLQNLKRLAPEGYSGHLGLFLDFSEKHDDTEVPDPYYGGAQGFEWVLDLTESASSGLLAHILNEQ